MFLAVEKIIQKIVPGGKIERKIFTESPSLNSAAHSSLTTTQPLLEIGEATHSN